ncbi:hypothetical protein [Hyphobacterium sp.]|uniref:hypothetical protein n=1 Tax=Hyphobacterium sp. TaxID=2004662 RepID=UPI003BACC676
MTISSLILAAALQSQPALDSGLSHFAVNWSYANRSESVFGLETEYWQAEPTTRTAQNRLQRLARPQPLPRSEALDVSQLGLSFEFHPTGRAVPDSAGWRFVVGFENERLEISPGATGAALLYRGGSVSVADGYAGMATPVGDRALVTLGYVRQERTAFAAAREWSDDSHFLGMTYQLSW